MRRHSGEHGSHSHEDWRDRSQDWHHSDEGFGSHGSREHGSHGSHGSDEDCGDHSVGGKIGVVAFICILAIIVVLFVVLCCLKKKNRRNASVRNLHVVAQVQPTQKAPPQYGVSVDMPTMDAKAMEALSVSALATAPAPAPQGPAVFGVPPPEYRSTVDMRAQPDNTRDEITSPPPTYNA